MSDDRNGGESPASQQELEAMIAEADTGGRTPTGIPAKVLWGVPLFWSLFQLWYVSPLPFILNIGLINSTQARSIHLALAVFLAFFGVSCIQKVATPLHPHPGLDPGAGGGILRRLHLSLLH